MCEMKCLFMCFCWEMKTFFMGFWWKMKDFYNSILVENEGAWEQASGGKKEKLIHLFLVGNGTLSLCVSGGKWRNWLQGEQ